MAYEVTSNDQLQMVEVIYSDGVSIEQRMAAMHDTLAILRETGIRRIIIDYDRARMHDDSIATISAFATRVATNAELRTCRIAFVGRQGHRFNLSVETMASARGYGFQRFFDRASAVAWLTA